MKGTDLSFSAFRVLYRSVSSTSFQVTCSRPPASHTQAAHRGAIGAAAALVSPVSACYEHLAETPHTQRAHNAAASKAHRRLPRAAHHVANRCTHRAAVPTGRTPGISHARGRSHCLGHSWRPQRRVSCPLLLSTIWCHMTGNATAHQPEGSSGPVPRTPCPMPPPCPSPPTDRRSQVLSLPGHST